MNSTSQLSHNDREMIALCKSPEMTVCELTESMGVTATAVRQRLNRLMTLELVQDLARSKAGGDQVTTTR